jgi:hypothetical protein
MRICGLSALLLLGLTLSAHAAKRATPDGHVAHTRRAPVAIHRMSPPYRGNHIYEKPQQETRPARTERDDSEPTRTERSDRESSRRNRSTTPR